MIAKWPASGLCILALGLATTGCVDDSYDMSKDIDMTMGIGADGLQLKVGSTEQIGLGKLLDFENEPLLGTTKGNLFYLTQSGSTDFDINVENVTIKLNEATLTPEINVWTSPINTTLPKNGIPEATNTKASDKFQFDAEGIKSDVKSIKHIIPAEESSHFAMRLEILGPLRDQLQFKSIKNLKITFPKFVKCKTAETNSYKITNDTGESVFKLIGNTWSDIKSPVVPLSNIDIEKFEFEDEYKIDENGTKTTVIDGGKPVLKNPSDPENGTINFDDNVRMEGDFLLEGKNASINVRANDYINIRLYITLGGKTVAEGHLIPVDLDKVKGCFDPKIKPEVDPVKIADELPDFLTDEQVTVEVSDVTLKFNVDMSEIPATLNINGVLMSKDKNENSLGDVFLPESGRKAELTKEEENILYFYEGQPFDVDADGNEVLAANGKKYEVNNLTSLITKLPDHVQIDLGGTNVQIAPADNVKERGEVKMKQDEAFEIRLGHRYNAHLDYNILMPFKFGGNLNIVYNDTIEDMNEDLQDYEATALAVTAKVVNTIPLNLRATLDAADINGNLIPEIKITPTKAYVTRATEYDESIKNSDGSKGNNVPVESELQFDITLDNPKDLKKLDKFFFRIEAKAKENENEEDADEPALMSNQYIIVKDMRLKLKGQIVGDFN